MTSKSRFYVDTPRDPSKRHSMFVSHSELAQENSNSSSATLPSAAGSVDRLTGLEEKKSSRFFTLKPKGTFSLKPFFKSSSSSLVSLSPGKRRKASNKLERRDSYSQTDESRTEFGEIGVQTLNASTVDVPVQTCLEAWEVGNGSSFGQMRLAYAPVRTSPFWNRPYASSSGLSNSSILKDVPKDSLASPKVVKYVAPAEFKKTPVYDPSAVSVPSVNSCQPVLSSSQQTTLPESTSVSAKYSSDKLTECSLEKNLLDSNTDENYDNVCSENINSTKDNIGGKNNLTTSDNNHISAVSVNSESFRSDRECESSEISKKSILFNKTESLPVENENKSLHGEDVLLDKNAEVSDISNDFTSQTIEHPHPISVLKIDRIDSPSRRPKTVHFDLPCSEPQIAVIENPTKARNVDKDFEALLRDLNVWTDDDENTNITASVNPIDAIAPKESSANSISANLKSAVDVLKQDFLAPIPEGSNECTSDDGSSVRSSLNIDFGNIKIESIDKKENCKTEANISEYKPLLTRSISEYDNQIYSEENKKDFPPQTSESNFALPKTHPDVETDSLEGNVYDNVIKEENPIQTVSLPTVPSFFEPPSLHHYNLDSTEIVENIQNSTIQNQLGAESESVMPLDTEFERSRLSRSSSRSSVRSNSIKTTTDSFQETASKFDSCENLDQLEEEIIRSLYSPDEGTLEDTIMNKMDLPPSESFQNSGTAATHMRRVILDQLLSGRSVEDIVPNYSSKFQRTNSVSEVISRHKPPQKYTAVLTRMENDDNGNQGNTYSARISKDNSHSLSNLDSLKDKKSENHNKIVEKLDSPKKATIFMFPERDQLNRYIPEKSSLEIFANPSQDNHTPILEVRRSSWTPQYNTDATKNGTLGNETKLAIVEEKSDIKSEKCDFTNCLKPSKLQNNPFISKINTRSMSPCNASNLQQNQNSTAYKNTPDNNPVRRADATGECKYENCLKPSQVQNSLFTSELSDSLRAGSPLPTRSGNFDHTNILTTRIQDKVAINATVPTRYDNVNYPSFPSATTESPISNHSNNPVTSKPAVSDCLYPTMFRSPNNDSTENLTRPESHKSEISIILQPRIAHSSDQNKEKLQDLSTSDEVSNTSVNDQMKDINHTVKHIPPDQDKVNFAPTGVAPPPPPPPPLPSSHILKSIKDTTPTTSSLETTIWDRKSNLRVVDDPHKSRSVTPNKTPVMAELEKILSHRKNEPHQNDFDDQIDDLNSAISDDKQDTLQDEKFENGTYSPQYSNGKKNGGIKIVSVSREEKVPLSNGKSYTNGTSLDLTKNTIITDEPPPPGAVLLDQKITVDGDKVHTDKYYAIPMKEVLKEKTSTTKFIPAPPKYDGIGPTEDGIPIAPRNSVKKENMHNWYKTMFKSLHKADSANDSQEYIIGYTSEPESSNKDIIVRKKSSTMDYHPKKDVNSNIKYNYPSAKSSIEVYNVHPRLIEDFEPGHSSVTDDEVVLSTRYLPKLKSPKPSYEFKNGYESDNTFTRKRDQPEGLMPEQQKMWYREVQKGADIPQFGLGKPAPEKPKEPVIGPLPPPPLNYNGPSRTQGIRPSTLPANYTNTNRNGLCQQMNGAYEMQMRNAIHSEMQHRKSPSSNQLSPPIRQMGKSPSRSPDLKIPAQALFDFKAESPKEVSLKKGDTILILRQLDKNWYEGEVRGVIGIFPISYVEIIPPEHASTPIKLRPEGLGRALYDFVAQTSIELTVRKGETIILLRRVDTNWFEAIFNNKKGIIPISYIQVLQEPVEKDLNSPSRSCPVSPRSESMKTPQKNYSLSPSAYSSSSTSPLPVSQERKLINKKSSHLVEPVMYRALFSYMPQNSDELELHEGDSVYVVEMCDDGWFVGTSVRTGVFGIFPGNYAEKAG